MVFLDGFWILYYILYYNIHQSKCRKQNYNKDNFNKKNKIKTAIRVNLLKQQKLAVRVFAMFV